MSVIEGPGQELRVFANALRAVLRLDPLFVDGRSFDQDEREIARFYPGSFSHRVDNQPTRWRTSRILDYFETASERYATDREFLLRSERRFFPKRGKRRGLA